MPGIDPKTLNTVVYLYPTEQAARTAEDAGGAGFFVSMPATTIDQSHHVYVVTATHVRGRQGDVWVRMMTNEGESRILELRNNDWIRHPDGDDVSVAAIDPQVAVLCDCIPQDRFLQKMVGKPGAQRENKNVGPGSDVFFITRLSEHGGKTQNLPAVRFGTVARAPLEPVLLKTGLRQEAFLVEVHSISGHSGSPVFVSPYPWSAHVLPAQWVRSAKLLGIDYGHLTLKSVVLHKGDETPTDPELFVMQNSGMAAVIPVWKIVDVLDSAATA